MKSKGIVSTWIDFKERELNSKKLEIYNECPGSFELTQCDYAEHLCKWKNIENQGRLTIVDFDLFKVDPLGISNKILLEMELEPLDEKNVMRLHANKSVAIRNKTLHKFAMYVFRRTESWLRSNPKVKSRLALLYDMINSDQVIEKPDIVDYLYLDKFYNKYFNK
jgi:hypothetical protein